MENIKIASFDIDDAKILSKLDEIKKNIDFLNEARFLEQKRLSELNKEYNSITKEMEKLTKSGKGQSKEFEDLANKQGQYLKNILQSKSAISDITTETRQLNNESRQLNQVLDVSKKAHQLLNKEYDIESKSINELREDRKILIQLRNQEVAVMGEQSEQAQKLNKIIEASTNQEKKLVAETEKRFYQIGDYAGQLESSFSGVISAIQEIGSGNVVSGVDNLKNSFGGLLQVVKKLVLTPIGAFITGLVAIGGAVSFIWEYNSAIKENLNLIKQLTKETGDSADNIRASIESISRTYNKDFKETLIEVKELANDFGLDYDRALSIYNKGLANGGALNKEFGDSIREYGVLFQQAGYSAEEFINLINTGYDLGVYNDKLPDAIKEAGLSLNEQTKATRDALINAFGAPFTDSILKRVKDGQITIKQALEEISKEAETANLNQQQWAQLTADVFRGAGEDAGGAKVVFDSIYTSIQNLNKPLEGIAKLNEELRQSYEDLEKAKDDFFKSDSLIEFQTNLKILWNNTLSKLFTDLNNQMTITTNIFKDYSGTVNAAFTALGDYLNLVKGTAKSFDLSSPISSFKSLVAIASSGTDIIASRTKTILTENEKARKEAEKSREYINAMLKWDSNGGHSQYKTNNNKSEEELKREEDARKKAERLAETALKKQLQEAEKKKKALEDAQKLEQKLIEDYAKYAYDLGQDELANQIKNNAEKLKNAKILTDAMLDLQIQAYKEEQKLEQQKLDNEKKENERKLEQEKQSNLKSINDLLITEQEKSNLKLQAEQTYQIQKDLNEQQYQQKTLENEKATQNAVLLIEQEFAETKKVLEQQRQEFDFQQKMLRLQNQNITEFDMQRVLLSQQYTQEMAMLRDKLNQKLITEQQFSEASVNLTKWENQQKNIIDRLELENKLNSYSSVLSSLGSLFEQNTVAYKATATASAIIDTYAGANKALNDKTVPSTFARWALAASTVLKGLANVKAINKVSTSVSSSVGGSGTANPTSLGTTTNTYKASYAGGDTGLSGLSQLSGYNQNNTFGNVTDNNAIAEAVKEGAKEGAKQGSQDGLIGLSTNRQILNNASY